MKSICSGLLGLASLVSVHAWAAEPDQVYRSACGLCHDSGVGGAPKLGDKEAWTLRLKQGREALYKIAIEGKPGTAMIAKGGDSALSETDIRAAVDYMIVKSQ